MAAKKLKLSGFTPYRQEDPPAGFYDPSLDSQRDASSRGLFDLGQDINTANTRARVDYGLGVEDIGRSQARNEQDLGFQRDDYQRGYDRSVADVNRGFGRNIRDLDTSGARGAEDYSRSVEGLLRRYGQLATSQRQQQARAGVVRGGAMLQAAAKRAQNQALDRQPLDTSYQRFQQDQATQRGRLGEDRDLTLGRLGEDRSTAFSRFDVTGQRIREDADTARGRLALDLAPPDANNPFGGRQWQDRLSQLTRAQREDAAFGLDVGAQKAYQAAGAGWSPPPMPSNQFTDPKTGQQYQVRIVGNEAVAVDPSGKVLWRRPRSKR